LEGAGCGRLCATPTTVEWLPSPSELCCLSGSGFASSALAVGAGCGRLKASPSIVECFRLAPMLCDLNGSALGLADAAGANAAVSGAVAVGTNVVASGAGAGAGAGAGSARGVFAPAEGNGARPSIVLANLFFWPDWRGGPVTVSKRTVSGVGCAIGWVPAIWSLSWPFGRSIPQVSQELLS